MSSPSVQIVGAVSERADPTALSFLSLPGEIRNNVYGYLLTREKPILLICSKQGRGSPAPSAVLVAGTNIFATSRQVHAEAIGIFYLRNQFLLSTEIFDYPVSVTKWIANWLDSLGHLANLLKPGSLSLGAMPSLYGRESTYSRCCDICGSRTNQNSRSLTTKGSTSFGVTLTRKISVSFSTIW
jgi:hypothetical protein